MIVKFIKNLLQNDGTTAIFPLTFTVNFEPKFSFFLHFLVSEACLESAQTTMMKFFVKIVNGF